MNEMTAPAFIPVMAEIGDKMPAIGEIWFVSFVFALIGVGCCCVWKWLYLLMVPLGGWCAYSVLGEFVMDTYFRDAVVTELGRGYLIQAVSASFVPLIALLASGLWLLLSRKAHPRLI
jgi:hypothetical protein